MNDKVYITVDIGGTKILLLLIDSRRRVLHRERFDTPRRAEPAELIRVVNSAASAALEKAGLASRDLSGLGVCIAALVDYEKGRVHQAPNLGWHRPVDFREMMEQSWPCPVFLDNDANAAVMGEVTFGAARGHRNAVYITVSTGIGGGLYLDGKLYRGSAGFAGEIGHIKPFGKGRRCGCGGMDCLEAWAAGTAIARSAGLLWPDKEAAGSPISTAWVFDQAEAGNPLARSIIHQALSALSTGLANLVTLLNPSCLIIGGGVARNRPEFLEQIRARIHRSAIAPAVNASPVAIVPAELEPEAGAWGMLALMEEEIKKGKEV